MTRASKPTRPMKRVLGDIASSVYSQILAMTPRQRRQAKVAIGKMTNCNCGWDVYAMRGVLLEYISMASWPRTRAPSKQPAKKG